MINEAPDLVDGRVSVDLADVSPVILLLDRGYVEVEATSYPVKKRVSWVLSHQETVQTEESSIVHSDPGDLGKKSSKSCQT